MSSVSKKGKQRQIEPSRDEPAASTSQLDGRSTNIKPAKKPEKIKLRRIHVSGLPSITEQDAKDRFKSFGEVVSVDGLGKLDGNGYPLQYAFLNIKTTKSKLAQCMNLLSGSMWKGSTLRISEAKSSVKEKLSQERELGTKSETSQSPPPKEKPKEKKSKKRKNGEGQKDASDEVNDEEKVTKKKKGWKLDPKTQTSIFPIVTRPDHPLPPPPIIRDDASTSKVTKTTDIADKTSKNKNKDASKSKDKKKEKQKSAKETMEATDDKGSLSPPSRAKRVRIDPTKWQQQHLREDELAQVTDTIDKTANNTSKSKTKITKVPQTEKKAAAMKHDTKVKRSKPTTTSELEESGDADNPVQTTTSSTKASENIVKSATDLAYDEQASLAERKANLDMVAKLLGGLPANLAPIAEDIVQNESESSDGEDSESEAENEADAPQFQETIKASKFNDQQNETVVDDAGSSYEDSTSTSSASSSPEPDEVAQVNVKEYEGASAEQSLPNVNSMQVETVVTSLPTESSAVLASSLSTSSEAEDSSNVEEDNAVDESETRNTEINGDTQDSHEQVAQDEVIGTTVTNMHSMAEVQMQSLTDMFKPQEASSGFILGDILDDLEMDELDIEPARPAGNAYGQDTQLYVPWSAPQAQPVHVVQHSAVGGEKDNGMLFFPFPLPGDELPGGLLYSMSEQEREQALARSWTGMSEIRRFKRTQTIDEITAQHESIRRTIGEQVRKRHREAVRTQKRHGGKRAQGQAEDL